MSLEAGSELCCCGWGVHVAFFGPEGNSERSVAVRGADTVVGLTNKLSRVLKKFLSASVWHISFSSFTFSAVSLLITGMEALTVCPVMGFESASA